MSKIRVNHLEADGLVYIERRYSLKKKVDQLKKFRSEGCIEFEDIDGEIKSLDDVIAQWEESLKRSKIGDFFGTVRTSH